MLARTGKELSASLELQRDAAAVAAALDGLDGLCSRAQQRLLQAESCASAQRLRHDSASASRLEFEERVEQLRAQAAANAAERDGLRTRASMAEGSKAELEGKVRELEETRLALEDERQTLLDRWQGLEQHVEAAVAERHELKGALAQEQAMLGTVRGELEAAKAAVDSSPRARQALAADVAALEHRLKSQYETTAALEAQSCKTEEAFLQQLERAHDERDAAMTERDAALLERNAARSDADAQAALKESAEAAKADHEARCAQLVADMSQLLHDKNAAFAEACEKAGEVTHLEAEVRPTTVPLAFGPSLAISLTLLLEGCVCAIANRGLSTLRVRAEQLSEVHLALATQLARVEQLEAQASADKPIPVLIDGDTQTTTVDLTSGETWRKLEERDRQLRVAESQLKDARERIQLLTAAAAERDGDKDQTREHGTEELKGKVESESGVGCEAVTALQEEAEQLRRQVRAQEAHVAELKQQHNIKTKEQLEKTSQERAKIAEEMRSAFRELQTRNERLQVAHKLVAVLEKKTEIMTEALERNNIVLSLATREQLAHISQEETSLRAQGSASAPHHLAAVASQQTAAGRAPASSAVAQVPAPRTPAKGVLKRASTDGDCLSMAGSAATAATQVAHTGAEDKKDRKCDTAAARRVAFVGLPEPEETVPGAHECSAGPCSPSVSGAALVDDTVSL